jgi:hypothetical protein
MPNEIVTVTINGANGPQTISVTVPVDQNSGTGSQTFTYTGSNGGSDTVTAAATVTGNNFSSNPASVNWQVTNNTIQMAAGVQCYAWGDSPQSGPVAQYIWSSGQRPLSSATAYNTNNSIEFDTFGNFGDNTDPNWYTVDANGTTVGQITFPPYNENFNCIILGNLIVPLAGTYAMTLTYKDGSMWGIGTSSTGAIPSWPGIGTFTNSYGQTQTVNGGYPLVAAGLVGGEGGVIRTNTTNVNFPSPGIYPVEVDWDYWYHSGRQLEVTINGAYVGSVVYIGPPPSGGTPSGNLTLTPTGGNSNFQFVGQPITLTVTLSGIVYSAVSYLPILEGTTGSLPLYNSPSSNTFSFQTYNGQPVDKTTIVPNNAISLSGDNNSWQGRLSPTYDGTNFNLSYSGSPLDANVGTTLLTISADDIAWYNSVGKTYDLFGVSNATGGVSTQILVNWLVGPSIASVSPPSCSADGNTHVFAVTLAKPLSPYQLGSYNTGNSISWSFSGNVQDAVPFYTPAGYLAGWDLYIAVGPSTTNGSFIIQLTLGETLTYLSGSSIVTNTLYPITGTIATISTTGSSYTAPTVYSFNTSPAALSYSQAVAQGLTSYIVPGAYGFVSDGGYNSQVNYTWTGAVFQTSNTPIVLYFTGVNSYQTYAGNIGAIGWQYAGNGQPLLQATQVNRYTAVVNGQSGYLTIFQAGISGDAFSDVFPNYGTYIGFIAVDQASGLSCSYYTSATYYSINDGQAGNVGNCDCSNCGGGSCVVAGTLVLMADGTQKRIEDVKIGDWVAGLEGANEVVDLYRPVLGPHRCLYRLVSGDLELFTTGDDKMWIRHEGKEQWGVYNYNDYMYEKLYLPSSGSASGMDMPHIIAEPVEHAHVSGWVKARATVDRTHGSETQLFHLICGGSHSYVANGYVTSARIRTDYSYDDAKWDPFTAMRERTKKS